MPAVFGILAFVYSGHGVFPSVRASMKEPKKYPKARASLLILPSYKASSCSESVGALCLIAVLLVTARS